MKLEITVDGKVYKHAPMLGVEPSVFPEAVYKDGKWYLPKKEENKWEGKVFEGFNNKQYFQLERRGRLFYFVAANDTPQCHLMADGISEEYIEKCIKMLWFVEVPKRKYVDLYTEDGVRIYIGMKYWWVGIGNLEKYNIRESIWRSEYVGNKTDSEWLLRFSTREKAQEYLDNKAGKDKKLFSYNDIEKMLVDVRDSLSTSVLGQQIKKCAEDLMKLRMKDETIS